MHDGLYRIAQGEIGGGQVGPQVGRVVFLGEGGDVSNDMNRKQLSVFGSWTFSKNGQADCARFVSERKLDVDGLFTHSWPLESAEDSCSTRRGEETIHGRRRQGHHRSKARRDRRR